MPRARHEARNCIDRPTVRFMPPLGEPPDARSPPIPQMGDPRETRTGDSPAFPFSDHVLADRKRQTRREAGTQSKRSRTRRLGCRIPNPLIAGRRTVTRRGIHWGDDLDDRRACAPGGRHLGCAPRSESIRSADGEGCGGQCHRCDSELHRPPRHRPGGRRVEAGGRSRSGRTSATSRPPASWPASASAADRCTAPIWRPTPALRASAAAALDAADWSRRGRIWVT